MYLPRHFAESRPEVLVEAMRRHPLATLLTVGAGGLAANHLPLLYSEEDKVLRGHMARANPQWREYPAGSGALAIFHGPQTYISPSWYPAKAEHGKVVPTWNYVVVHAHGPLTIYEDPDWLLRNVTALTETHEAGFEAPWQVSDAPEDYVQGLLRAIVGVELKVEKLEGKWKASQNRSVTDREGVAAGLEEMADVVRGTIESSR